MLIHIQDLSHPNIIAQHNNVLDILRKLKIRQSLIDSMISVGNKIDRISMETLKRIRDNAQIKGNTFTEISCRNGEGLSTLIQKIDLVKIYILKLIQSVLSEFYKPNLVNNQI